MSRRALTLKKYHLVFLEGSVSIAVSKKTKRRASTLSKNSSKVFIRKEVLE
jgi:hypothetical protein